MLSRHATSKHCRRRCVVFAWCITLYLTYYIGQYLVAILMCTAFGRLRVHYNLLDPSVAFRLSIPGQKKEEKIKIKTIALASFFVRFLQLDCHMHIKQHGV